MAPDAHVTKFGLIRSYVTRHGPGPLPTETHAFVSKISEHNHTNPWQGEVRYGWFDAALTRYALDVNGGLDTLVVTHMDALSNFDAWMYCQEYRNFRGTKVNPAGDGFTRVPRLSSLTLEQRAEFTQALLAVTPVFKTCDANEAAVIARIESLLGQQVGMISRGPRAEDVTLLTALPF